jgi:hypothetical protein
LTITKTAPPIFTPSSYHPLVKNYRACSTYRVPHTADQQFRLPVRWMQWCGTRRPAAAARSGHQPAGQRGSTLRASQCMIDLHCACCVADRYCWAV